MPTAPKFESSDIPLIQQVHQYWNSGNQPAAVDTLRPRAEAGQAWAAALLAWLLMQQGAPGIDESVTWAVKAAELGAPGQTIHTFNNAIAQLPSAPQLAERLPELLEWAWPWSTGVDLVGQGWNLIAQGQVELALQVMTLSAPWPTSDPQWASMREVARQRSAEIDELAVAAAQRREAFEDVVSQATSAIEKARDDLKTSANQANLLVSVVRSDATNALYKADASRNEKESRGVWRWGLGILGVAAVVAVLPLILHYMELGPNYSTPEVIGVHIASTAALGTFAGVLLARARSRDRAAQRAHDLSTAMGTMISYSNQIIDPIEKERFMMTMGQLVLQAHLTSGSGKSSNDESMTGVIALANALRSVPLSAPTSPQA